jgi:replication-associated recombination protein RarA
MQPKLIILNGPPGVGKAAVADLVLERVLAPSGS